MSELWWRPRTEVANVRVSEEHPLPVQLPEESTAGLLPPVAGHTVWRQRTVQGIGTGAAYADKDQLGTLLVFPNVFRPGRRSGLLHTALYYDLDDEGLQVDLHFFRRVVTPAADNAAFALSDADALAYLGTVQFSTFYDFANNQMSQASSVGLALESDSVNLFALVQARGALNIAAANLPAFAVAVLPD